MYVIPTVKLKLDVNEAHVIFEVAKHAFELVERQKDRKNIKNDTIMMADYYPVISKQITAHMFQHVGKSLKSYNLPMAVGRSIHSRLQSMPATYSRQKVLLDIDVQLTKFGYKPAKQLQLL